MNRLLLYLLFFVASFSSYGQGDFELPQGVRRISIPFEKINNLIVLPVNINGADLNFILDTGATRTIVFNTYDIDSLNFNKGQRLKISGYGKRMPFEVFYSDDNQISSMGYAAENAELFVMVEGSIDLSGFFGINIHGLIGFDFFADHIIEIDYSEDMIHVHDDNRSIRKKMRRSSSLPMRIIARKPYIETLVENNNSKATLNTLIDTGNGDAMWLFPPFDSSITPKKSFEDQLGVGMSGRVEGIRSKVSHATIGKYKLNKVTLSIPQEESLKNRISNLNDEEFNRASLGGDVLRRFKVILDYKNQRLYLRARPGLKKGFYYNMSGIEIMEGDLEIFSVIEEKKTETDQTYSKVIQQSNALEKKRKVFKVAPKLVISYVRPFSTAEEAGLKVGDVITKFNNQSRDDFSIEKITKDFFEKPYSNVRFTVKRGAKLLKIKFKLVPLI